MGICIIANTDVNHYQRVVETAARHQMTLDAHEPIKDTGIRRTWPNMMTREGARGMEWNAWSEGNPPSHHVMLPFTRLLSGPMDYTPGTFDILFLKTKDSPRRQKWNDQDKGNSRVNTTLAKQLANWVILYSPLQMASDMIEHYEDIRHSSSSVILIRIVMNRKHWQVNRESSLQWYVKQKAIISWEQLLMKAPVL